MSKSECHVWKSDDGSIVIEFFGDGQRLALSFDPDSKQSGWYSVYKFSDPRSTDMPCESFDKMNLKTFERELRNIGLLED